MTVNVEFYGIPRERAGVGAAVASGATLGEVLVDLAARFPKLADTCLGGNRLRAGLLANLDGRRFISDPATMLKDGDSLLLLSADAGG